MSAQVAIESSTATAAVRRQQMLTVEVTSWTLKDNRFNSKNESTSGSCSCMGETTGECAAVCCCCPFAMLHLLILAVYHLPIGLRRKKKRKKMLRKKRKSLSEEKENQQKTDTVGFCMDDDDDEEEEEEKSADCEDYRGKNDAVHWDNEMCDRFYGAGFWRSASQRKNDE